MRHRMNWRQLHWVDFVIVLSIRTQMHHHVPMGLVVDRPNALICVHIVVVTVTLHTPTHIDINSLVNGVHGLYRPMTLLTGNPSSNVFVVRKISVFR